MLWLVARRGGGFLLVCLLLSLKLWNAVATRAAGALASLIAPVIALVVVGIVGPVYRIVSKLDRRCGRRFFVG